MSSKKTASQEATIQDQISKLTPVVKLLELRTKRLQYMNELSMLDVETAVQILSSIDLEIRKKSPAVIGEFNQVRDKMIFEWKIDPEKYKQLIKTMEDSLPKEKSTLEIIKSGNTSEEDK